MTTLKQAHLASLDDINALKINHYSTALIPPNMNGPVILPTNASVLQVKNAMEALAVAPEPEHDTYQAKLDPTPRRITITAALLFIVGFALVMAYNLLTQFSNFWIITYLIAPIIIGLGLYVATLSIIDLFKIYPVTSKNYIKEDIYNATLLLPSDAIMTYYLQCEAAENIDGSTLTTILQYEPALTYDRQEIIVLILEVLLAEQIDNDIAREARMEEIAYLYTDVINTHNELPDRFRPLIDTPEEALSTESSSVDSMLDVITTDVNQMEK